MQQKHMVDCIKVPMEPTPTAELNKVAVVAVHCVVGWFQLETTVNHW